MGFGRSGDWNGCTVALLILVQERELNYNIARIAATRSLNRYSGSEN